MNKIDIPTGWSIKKLGNLATITRGASPRPIHDPIWFDDNSNIGWLRISDLTKSDKYLFETVQKLSSKGVSHSRFVENNSLILSICATVGQPIISKIDTCIHDGFVVFYNLSSDIEFIYYVLTYIRGEWFKSGQTGSQMNLNTSIINDFTFLLPPLTEQQKIAQALTDADNYISALEKLIEKKKMIKEGLMVNLLTGKQRLKEFAFNEDGTAKSYKDSELGKIPEDWEVIELIDTASKSKKWSFVGGPFGSSLKTDDYTEYGIQIIQLQNMGDGHFINDNVIYTSVEKANELLSNNIYAGEIIISKMGDPVARACIMPNHADRYLMASDGIRLSIDTNKFDTRFIHDFINFKIFRKQAINASTGSTRQRISLSELKKLKLFSPSYEEQLAIGNTFKDLDSQILALDQKLNKAKLLKQGMMQKLLTGEIRLA